MKANTRQPKHTQDLMRIQQKINHYNHIVEAKPNIDMSCPVSVRPSRFKNKLYNKMERERLFENEILVKKLTKIRHTEGVFNEHRYQQSK